MKISVRHQQEIKALVPEKEQQNFIDETMEKAIGEIKAQNADTVEIYVDGGSRGNPGPAGGGYGIYKAGTLVDQGSEFFGDKTNNQAEYLALRLALREAYEKYPKLRVYCFMDSQLVVEQMNANYKVKSENVRPLFEEVRRIADQFEYFKIEHVPREQNKLADKLANEAMDRGH